MSLLPFELNSYAWSFQVSALKPDPRIFQRACEVLGVEPGDGLMVGDSLEADYHGARAAGMRALHLDREVPLTSGAWSPGWKGCLAPVRAQRCCTQRKRVHSPAAGRVPALHTDFTTFPLRVDSRASWSYLDLKIQPRPSQHTRPVNLDHIRTRRDDICRPQSFKQCMDWGR